MNRLETECLEKRRDGGAEEKAVGGGNGKRMEGQEWRG